MTGEEWASVLGGAVATVSGMVSVAMRAWHEGNATPPARKPLLTEPIGPPLPPHVGGYRTNPRPQAMVPRRATWWRLASAWWRGTFTKIMIRDRSARLLAAKLHIDGKPATREERRVVAYLDTCMFAPPWQRMPRRWW